MRRASSYHNPPSPANGGHRLAKWLAVIAIFLAMFLITWARVVIHGTEDIEAALIEPIIQSESAPRVDPRNDQEREVDAAVTSSRFATGLSP
jgi:hypothetical protein